MPRIRTIKPKFWDDLKLSKVSRDARLTYIGMWTFSDDLGVIIAEPIWLKSKIFPFDQIQVQQFERWLSELVQQGFISLFSYREEKFYYLPTLTKHQVINRPNYDEVNVPKAELERILEHSRNDHGTITETSVQERKGEERKGEDGSKGDVPPPPVLLLTPEEEEQLAEWQSVEAWIKEKAPRVMQMKEPLTMKDYFKLKDRFDVDYIPKTLQAMHNWSKLTKERVNAYLTFLSFAKRDTKAA